METTESSTVGHATLSEDRYLNLEKLKAEHQKKSDQVLGLKREIAQRQGDFADLRNEVTSRQIEREKLIDDV